MLKKIGLAAITLLMYTNINAQSLKPRASDMNFPKIPRFFRQYDTSIDKFLVSAKGDVNWKSDSLKLKNESITQIRGHCDLNVKFAFIGIEKIYVGFISKINKSEKTIETIVYSNGHDEKNFSSADSSIASLYNIDLSKASDIEHILADYQTDTLIDLETGDKRLIQNNAVGFQEGYFMASTITGKDTVISINYNNKIYSVPIIKRIEDESKTIFIDMTYPNPDDPEERLSIIDKMRYLKIFIDSEGLPYKVDAGMNGPLGMNVEAEATIKK